MSVEFSGVWAFLVFLLNYIPTIGSVMSIILPSAFAAATQGYSSAVAVFIGLSVIEAILGNVLDPKVMGKSLNLSTLAILINLVFWGMIWGPVGMFFSVPILAAIYVACAQFDKTRPISILLSADGSIPDKNG